MRFSQNGLLLVRASGDWTADTGNGALAARAEGTSHFEDGEELRVKESDRIATTCEMLRRLGVEVEERKTGFSVQGLGGRPFAACEVEAHGDHRIAMSAVIAGLGADGPVCVRDVDNVATSFPSFVDTLTSLGAELRVTALDQLLKPRRGQSGLDRTRRRRPELRSVACERLALPVVLGADVHDEGGLHRVLPIGEGVQHLVRPVSGASGPVPRQAGEEAGVPTQLRGDPVVGVPSAAPASPWARAAASTSDGPTPPAPPPRATAALPAGTAASPEVICLGAEHAEAKWPLTAALEMNGTERSFLEGRLTELTADAAGSTFGRHL